MYSLNLLDVQFLSSKQLTLKALTPLNPTHQNLHPFRWASLHQAPDAPTGPLERSLQRSLEDGANAATSLDRGTPRGSPGLQSGRVNRGDPPPSEEPIGY